MPTPEQTEAERVNEDRDSSRAAARPLEMGQEAMAVLKRALAFIDKASGTALGIAMSGRKHPNPDEVLTDLAQEGLALAAELRVVIASAPSMQAEIDRLRALNGKTDKLLRTALGMLEMIASKLPPSAGVRNAIEAECAAMRSASRALAKQE